MDCSTCGAVVPEGRRECSECGTRVRFAPARIVPRTAPAGPLSPTVSDEARPSAHAVTTCPRCGYRGDGVPYFSRGTHIALLVGLVVLTAGFIGAAGVIFYLMRRDHRVCPRCGLDWGKSGDLALAAPGRLPVPAGRFGRRGLPGPIMGWMLIAFGVLIALLGIVEGELVPAVIGAALGGSGWLLQRTARSEREERRAALLARLQLPVLSLAAERDGRLTVTEVAASLGWTLPRAEKVLESMNDGLRVTSDVTREGVIVYEFIELRHRPDLLPPEGPVVGEP